MLESDGAQNRGSITPIQAAQVAKKAGVRVYGVALGTPNGTVAVRLRALRDHDPRSARPGDGRQGLADHRRQVLHRADADQLSTSTSDLGSSLGRKTELREITSWFAIATAVLLVVAVGLSRLWSAPLP